MGAYGWATCGGLASIISTCSRVAGLVSWFPSCLCCLGWRRDWCKGVEEKGFCARIHKSKPGRPLRPDPELSDRQAAGGAGAMGCADSKHAETPGSDRPRAQSNDQGSGSNRPGSGGGGGKKSKSGKAAKLNLFTSVFTLPCNAPSSPLSTLHRGCRRDECSPLSLCGMRLRC